METFQHVLTQVVTVAPRLSGSEARLLTHLTYLGLIEASTEVQVSERALMAGTGLGHGPLQRAKVKLHEKGLIRQFNGTCNTRDRYHLAYLNGVQLPLFTKERAPESGAGVRPDQAQGAPESGAGVRPDQAQGAPGSGAGVRPDQAQGAPGSGAQNGGKGAGVRPNQAHEGGTAEPDIQGTRARRSIDRGVIGTSGFLSIDRVLSQTTITEENRPAAELLSSALVSFAAKRSAPGMSPAVPDDRILAQCLAIRPAVECREALYSLADNLRGRQITKWSWFVTAFLAHFEGVSPDLVKQRRQALRMQRTTDGATTDLQYRDSVIDQLNRSAKTLR